MSELLLFKNCGGQNDAFAPLLDSRTQKQRAQVLLHGAWADVEFRRDFFIAAALQQQFQNVLIAARILDLFQVQHALLLSRSICPMVRKHHKGKHVFRQTFAIGSRHSKCLQLRHFGLCTAESRPRETQGIAPSGTSLCHNESRSA